MTFRTFKLLHVGHRWKPLAAAVLVAFSASCSDDGNGLRSVLVTGTLRLRGQAPLPGATIAFLEPAQSGAIRSHSAPLAPGSTIYENPPVAVTDANGRYSVAVSAGLYDVWVGGGPDSGFYSVHVAQVILSKPQAPLDLSYPGYRVGGRMLHLNLSLAAGSVFVQGSTNSTRAELHDDGSGSGERAYSLLLPAGTYDFWANPNQGYWGVPRVKFEGITVGADTTIDLVCDGHFIAGTVTSWDGTLMYNGIISATSPNASAWNYIDSIGRYGLHLPTGTYDFTITPPPGADTLAVLNVQGVLIDAPSRTVDFQLQQAP